MPPKTQAKKAAKPSALSVLKSKLAAVMDRSDPKVKTYQDLVLHAALFAGAIYMIHNHGHKLAI